VPGLKERKAVPRKSRELVDIVVVGYNLPEMEADCIQSVIQHTDWPYVLTYYDNYETGSTLTQVWNWFIKASPCPHICLLNSDTIVYDGWLSRMMETLLADPKVGCVGPSTDNCHGRQNTIPTYEAALQCQGKIEVTKEPICGFCVLFRKSLWIELRGFDERYNFYGQESDFIDRAQRQGYKSVWRQDAFVHHIGEQSITHSKMDVNEERQKAKDLYWSTRPHPGLIKTELKKEGARR